MIYFDNASSTQVDSEILELFSHYSFNSYANTGGIHAFSREVAALQNASREEILKLLHYDNGTLIFTSSGTEANNLFLQGAFLKYQNRGKEIIISAYEHPSVTNVCEMLEQRFGAIIKVLPITKEGTIDLVALEKAISNQTIIVSIMGVNNEIGFVNDLMAIKKIVAPFPKIIFHSDLTQAIGKITPKVDFLDAITFSAHKIHGLKGSGAVIINKKLKLEPQIVGGTQEDGFRAGTTNSAANICLSKTLKKALIAEKEHFEAVNELASHLRKLLLTREDLFCVNSSANNPYIVNFSLLTRQASIVLNALENKGIYVGTTSSCSLNLNQPSKSVLAFTNDLKKAQNSLRVSFSSLNNLAEVDVFFKELMAIVDGSNYGS